MQWPGVDVADRDVIRGAARTPVDPRADLSLGRLNWHQWLAQWADAGSGFEQARARLANLIRYAAPAGAGPARNSVSILRNA